MSTDGPGDESVILRLWTYRLALHPIPELEQFLRPYRHHFYRVESLQVLERYATGLLARTDRKSGTGVAHAVVGLSDSAIYRLMVETMWDEAAVSPQRIEIMVSYTVVGDGIVSVR